jgi:hypothetical protein
VSAAKEDEMLYMFLLYHDPAIPPPEDVMERHFAVADEARSKNAYVCSEAIGGTEDAVTVRVRGGKTKVTDGPFIETKEVLGGFYILECKNLEEAIAYAEKIPDSASGVEVRPLMHVQGWDYAHPGERKAFG